jgi:hypothetical protein
MLNGVLITRRTPSFRFRTTLLIARRRPSASVPATVGAPQPAELERPYETLVAWAREA